MGTSFGRGGATTFQQDLVNADVIVIQGSNMAEAHPVGFQYVVEAQRRGAKVVHVDPRFTRTSALADVHVPIRAGSDIAFLGGIVNAILSEGREFREYVTAYTNASTILREDFADTEDLDGLFSGWDPDARSYDPTSWQYAGREAAAAAGDRSTRRSEPEVSGAARPGAGARRSREGGGGGRADREATTMGQTEPAGGHGGQAGGGAAGDGDAPERDLTLTHPRCVFQVLKRHFARYTPEVVSEVCGISPAQFAEVVDALCDNSGRKRTGAFCYAVGWTQHSVGVQYIRTAAIIQLLLGNVGRPGGGILALRGHASIQGSTDIPTLFDMLPGYLPMPHPTDADLATYVRDNSATTGWWGNMGTYMVSLLKAWWGDAATPENDFRFDNLPRITGDHSTYATSVDMLDGNIEGYVLWGQNPAVGSSNGRLHRLAMAQLDWLVVRDLFETESASFWYDAPEIETGGLSTVDIGTEVFLLPSASHTEKAGSFTQTQRLQQWRDQAVEPEGDRRSDLWFAYHLGRRIREKLAGSIDPRDRPLLELTWDYPAHGVHDEPAVESVLAEINGFDLSTGKPGDGFAELRDDGTTACGCWIYSCAYAEGVNQARRRKPGSEQSWVAPEWGWAWPANRRLLYNRASADPEGKPWSERKRYVWWDPDAGSWTGEDVPDFPIHVAPDFRPEPGARAEAAISGDDAFIMQSDGKGWLYVPAGLVDGPLPTHYEPAESPFTNPLYAQRSNPGLTVPQEDVNPLNATGDEAGAEAFPYVMTTYRITEHHTAGGMSRTVGHLSELAPEMFCEVGPGLAAERCLDHGGWATIVTCRTAIEARVLVTDRVPSLRVQGRELHQVGMPYHWGSQGLVTGDSANDLFPLALDPNVNIQEVKAATCDVLAGRRPRGPALRRLVERHEHDHDAHRRGARPS